MAKSARYRVEMSCGDEMELSVSDWELGVFLSFLHTKGFCATHGIVTVDKIIKLGEKADA